MNKATDESRKEMEVRLRESKYCSTLKEKEAFEGQITLMPEDTNWLEMKW